MTKEEAEDLELELRLEEIREHGFPRKKENEKWRRKPKRIRIRCQKDFVPAYPFNTNQVYCSEECRNEFYKNFQFKGEVIK
jgi:hypothetical protein